LNFKEKIFFVKDEQLAKLNNLKKICKKSNRQVLNDKNVLASILNLGAILKFHAWQHFFFFF
jgi:hypothetical protein